jgi:xanthine dehydrogenase accessory factor
VRPDVLELAAELSKRGEPFVLATVVWRRAPSSGKEGSTALITPDGRVRGWLGGACAEPTVIRESLLALEEGTPRLLFLGPPEELEARGRQGVVTVPIACQSEGALEVYVEPVVPQPHLVITGRSPAVAALAAMAGALGWRTVVVDDGGDPADYPAAGRVVTSLDFEEAGVTDRSWIVVATQGHYDEDALERALVTSASYVGLVASPNRARAVLGYLRDRGISEESLARVRAPAGLDLGRVSHEEIAVAILAELVRDRVAGVGHGQVPLASPRHEAVDRVCGMTVDVATARHRSAHEERTYYFCSAGCRERFEADPARFAAVTG